MLGDAPQFMIDDFENILMDDNDGSVVVDVGGTPVRMMVATLNNIPYPDQQELGTINETSLMVTLLQDSLPKPWGVGMTVSLDGENWRVDAIPRIGKIMRAVIVTMSGY